MINTTTWDEVPTMDITLTDGDKVAAHKLPMIPGVSHFTYQILGAKLEALAVNMHKASDFLTTEEIANIRTQAVIERMSGPGQMTTGHPVWVRVFAEQAGRAIWDWVRTAINTIDRIKRYGRGPNAPTHLKEGHRAYFNVAAMDAAIRCDALDEAMMRAVACLQAFQPNASPSKILGQVIDAIEDLMSLPHPEEVPALGPHY